MFSPFRVGLLLWVTGAVVVAPSRTWAQTPVVSASVNAPTPATRETLIGAVNAGDIERVKAILKENPEFVSGTGYRTPIGEAISGNQLEIARFLLEHGADPNDPTTRVVPLAEALTRYDDWSWKPLAELLVSKGALVNGSNQSGASVLGDLITNPPVLSDEKIKWLLAHGADIYRTGRGTNAFDLALSWTNSNSWKILLPFVDPSRRDDLGQTALFSGVRARNAKIVATLLARGANVNAQNINGETPLHLLARGNGRGFLDTELLQMLLAAGANPNLPNVHGDLPLHIALQRSDALFRDFDFPSGSYSDSRVSPLGQTLAPLLALTDINARASNGSSPLLLAILSRDTRSRELILARHPVSDEMTTFLNEVAGGETRQVARRLSKHPLLATQRLFDGSTALHLAAWWGTTRAAQELVKRGADVNARDALGQTPLHFALLNPKGRFRFTACEITAFLLQHGADANNSSAQGDTPLHLAARAGDSWLINTLLAGGARLDARGANNETALFILTRKDVDFTLYRSLLDRGADPNARSGVAPLYSSYSSFSASGWGVAMLSLVPLHRAVIARRPDLVRLLLEHGAQVNALDGEGKTPLLMTQSLPDYSNETLRPFAEPGQIATLLLDKGADPLSRYNGQNLLQTAADRGLLGVTRALLLSKKVTLKSAGITPTLFGAALRRNNLEQIRLLLDAGASPTATDDFGRTPLQNASSEEARKLLQERIAAQTATVVASDADVPKP